MKLKGVVSASYCTDDGDTKIHIIPENPDILREIDGDHLVGFGGRQVMAVLGKVPRPETGTVVELDWDAGVGTLIVKPNVENEKPVEKPVEVTIEIPAERPKSKRT